LPQHPALRREAGRARHAEGPGALPRGRRRTHGSARARGHPRLRQFGNRRPPAPGCARRSALLDLPHGGRLPEAATHEARRRAARRHGRDLRRTPGWRTAPARGARGKAAPRVRLRVPRGFRPDQDRPPPGRSLGRGARQRHGAGPVPRPHRADARGLRRAALGGRAHGDDHAGPRASRPGRRGSRRYLLGRLPSRGGGAGGRWPRDGGPGGRPRGQASSTSSRRWARASSAASSPARRGSR